MNNPCKGCIVLSSCKDSFPNSVKIYTKCINMIKNNEKGIINNLHIELGLPIRSCYSQFSKLQKSINRHQNIVIYVSQCGWKAILNPDTEKVETIYIDEKIFLKKIEHPFKPFETNGTCEVKIKSFPVIETRFPGRYVY